MDSLYWVNVCFLCSPVLLTLALGRLELKILKIVPKCISEINKPDLWMQTVYEIYGRCVRIGMYLGVWSAQIGQQASHTSNPNYRKFSCKGFHHVIKTGTCAVEEEPGWNSQSVSVVFWIFWEEWSVCPTLQGFSPWATWKTLQILLLFFFLVSTFVLSCTASCWRFHLSVPLLFPRDSFLQVSSQSD